MVTKLNFHEWMVEPYDKDSREYARLHVSIEAEGINIDGQGVIPWMDIMSSYDFLERAIKEKREKLEKRHAR